MKIYFNTVRWSIDITLSIAFIFFLEMYLFWVLIKLERRIDKIGRKGHRKTKEKIN